MIKSILILDSSINEINIKNTNISDDILYKKCNMKNNNNFSKIFDWNYSNYRIELWGKNKGINKFKSSLFSPLKTICRPFLFNSVVSEIAATLTIPSPP